MSELLGFDPDDYDYGPASPAIRRILLTRAEVDWFVPSAASDEELIGLFAEHTALAHPHAPELVPERVSMRCVSGGWSEFTAWCKRVREQTRWDWKFSVLKKLSFEHAKRHGWSLQQHAASVPKGMPRPGDLFIRLDDAKGEPFLVWNNVFPPVSELDLSPAATDSARFYRNHVDIDVSHAIEWQLAERTADATANPFVPLLRCIRAGAYPFSLDRDTVVLFRFTADEQRLPTATLIFRG